MTKWRHETVEGWLKRVRIECRCLALQINNGVISGPDIADRIEQLVVKASERKPEGQHA